MGRIATGGILDLSTVSSIPGYLIERAVTGLGAKVEG